MSEDLGVPSESEGFSPSSANPKKIESWVGVNGTEKCTKLEKKMGKAHKLSVVNFRQS